MGRKEPSTEKQPVQEQVDSVRPFDPAVNESLGAFDGWSVETFFSPSLPELFDKSRSVADAVQSLCERIGDFEIESMIGEGAFGKVFLARQVSLDRIVALKVTADFGYEGRTMARLEHPRIVQVFSESVDAENKIRLLCLQFVGGSTLRQTIHDLRSLNNSEWTGEDFLRSLDAPGAEPVSLDPASFRDRELLASCNRAEAVCFIGQQISEALAYAHGQGVLHRDIKPANVIINSYGQPMLTDFSLSFQATAVAHLGAAVFGGTLGYMAPEHLDAFDPSCDVTPQAVDERSDIYSLGIMALELFNGEPPSCSRERISTVAYSHAETDNHSASLPARDHLDRLHEANAPRPLATLLRRCLEESPAERYQMAQSLSEAFLGCRRLLRVSRNTESESVFARYAHRSPLRFILVFTILPNILASIVNIAYINFFVAASLSSEQQTAFRLMVLYYNIIVCVVMAGLVHQTLLKTVRQWWKLLTDTNHTNAQAKECRDRIRMLPYWGVLLGCLGWLPFAVVVPVGMEAMAGPIDRGTLLHVSVAFLMTGLIAIVENYFVISYVVYRSMYLRTWGDGTEFPAHAQKELETLPSKNGLFQKLAGLTPLGAATILAAVGPSQFGASEYDRFRWLLIALIGAGILGFWYATSATSILNRRAEEISRAANHD